jgi:hypothetical protein
MMNKQLFLLIIILSVSWTAMAQKGTDGPLGDLFMAKEGGLVQYSSADPTGGNDDNRSVGPGEELVLVDHEGAGVLKRWWITIAPRNNKEIQRNLIVRCYWDGEEDPSVEVPVSDFFGMGFGEWKDYISLPLNMTSGGYNAYWPMPFHEEARITVENTGNQRVESFYYNIDIRTFQELPDDALYFHAQYRQTTTRTGKPVEILETSGRGHYVGTLLSMQPKQGSQLGYLEGDEMIYVDGEEKPGIIGTGTEDYFSSGWYYITGEYSAPYHGISIKDTKKGRVNTYRWHIEDPIPFGESFTFEIEHGGTNNAPGVVYSSVAYWYQTHPHPEFPELPENLLPLSTSSLPEIEAEELIEESTVTNGRLQVQDMSNFDGQWGGDEQLWWIDGRPGDRLNIPIQVDEQGEYELIGFFTRARDYGIFRILVNGEPVGNLIDGFSPQVEATGPQYLGRVSLPEGENTITVELVGKETRASGFGGGYLVGIDGFYLRE